MKVHLIKKQTIEDFMLKNAQSRSSLVEWMAKVRYADWNDPSDFKKTFATADILWKGSNRVVLT